MTGRPRYFVDLAANHAIYLSNTRSLERDHGWEGTCIEANEQLAYAALVELGHELLRRDHLVTGCGDQRGVGGSGLSLPDTT